MRTKDVVHAQPTSPRAAGVRISNRDAHAQAQAGFRRALQEMARRRPLHGMSADAVMALTRGEG